MQVYQKVKATPLTYPSFDIVELEKNNQGQTNLIANDHLCIDGQYRFRIGSVASYAIECGRCPIADFNRTVEQGHKTHFVTQMAVSLSISNVPRGRFILIDSNQLIKFEGRVFKLTPAPNDNYNLVEQVA